MKNAVAWVVVAGVAGIVSCSKADQAPGGGEVGADVPAFFVRPEYKVTLAAKDLGEARFLEGDEKGVVYLSQPQAGSIMSLRDKDGDGTYETRAKFITGHPSVHGMHYKDGWLYFTQASTGATHRARDTNDDGQADEKEVVLPPGSVPAGGGHAFRAILVADDAIYISVSDPSNMTEELNTDRKKIYRFDRDGKNRREFSSGIRNTEKLQFRPGTTEIYGCDHGSDWFGRPYGDERGRQPITDMNPPEELNHYVDGGFYGHPYLMGHRVPRPEFANRPDIIELASKTIPPAYSFPAHWAPNGFSFLSKDHFPNHKGDMFIAFHGSWNRSEKGGYCVQRVLFDELTGKPYGSLTAVRAVTDDGNVLARPCDVMELADGSVLFTCDHTRRIYRIQSNQTKQGQTTGR